MADFVARDSIVRRIWGDGDKVLLVFAGCAAEFALNRAVDWLFFTGKLPNDPVGRLFATAGYAQEIVFADELTASRALERIRAVHQAVERQRERTIPDWAYRDVLYMLIHYSERAHELLARALSPDEQNELYDVFHRVGAALRIPDLPPNYAEWRTDRERHLGPWRYSLLLHLQSILTPEHVRDLLQLESAQWLLHGLRLYPFVIHARMRSSIQRLLIPAQHLGAVRALDQRTVGEASDSPRPGCHRALRTRPVAREARRAIQPR